MESEDWLLAPCPFLPPPLPEMDAGVLSAHGPSRGADFYLSALTYGHFLWRKGLPARAILKLDRALGADLRGDEEVLREFPLPYEAMAWFLAKAPPFNGNPRVHFQHLADRMNEPRREQRRWRTWACWALCRVIQPDLQADPKHLVEEPSHEQIAERLDAHGLAGERSLWQNVLRKVSPTGGIVGRP